MFDKFMEKILKQEKLASSLPLHESQEHDETLQRRKARLYSERWQNRINWGRKTNE